MTLHSLRKKLKIYLPTGVRRLISSALDRPGIETLVLRDYGFLREDSAVPRITLIMPGLSKKKAFGGMSTAVSLFLSLAKLLKSKMSVDIRILSENDFDPEDALHIGIAAKSGLDVVQLNVRSLPASNWKISTRPNEVFVVYCWWISRNLDSVLKAQEATFARFRQPKIHILQEYEPSFYPFSSAHLLAREAIDNRDGPLWIVMNTHELSTYYDRQGHSASRRYIFEPRMDSSIKAFLEGMTREDKSRTVLVYGRPKIPRNCFSIIEAGLKCWATHTRADPSWKLVSAGISHPDIALGGGRKLVSVGKLGLADYGRLLRETSIGISLMASPHPSYPPLEMAHFGARTITNSYDCKDPNQRHDNLIPLRDFRPETFAAELDRSMEMFECDPGFGLNAKSRMPEYLEGNDFECLETLGNDIFLHFSELKAV